jgi:hypothetical protein
MFMFPASILSFFVVQIKFSYIILVLVLHLLHFTFYNLHLLDWMGLEGRSGKVASDFVIQKLLVLQ